ncbi:UNVERIFIED_ORG: hypothetical protein ABIC81_004877, partial [Bacillus proteolyticus]
SLVSLKNVRKDFTKPYKKYEIQRVLFEYVQNGTLLLPIVKKMSPMPKGIGLIFLNLMAMVLLGGFFYVRLIMLDMPCYLEIPRSF